MSGYEWLFSSSSISVEERTSIKVDARKVGPDEEMTVIRIDAQTASENGTTHAQASFTLFLPNERVAEVIDLLVEATK